MNEATKDLAYFQQQVAEKYGWTNWDSLIADEISNCKSFEVDYVQVVQEYFKEAAEAYAAYRFEQGKKEGEAEHYIKGFDAGLKKGEAIGWNEAIHWAAEHAQSIKKDCSNVIECGCVICDHPHYTIDKQSILNGLKQEEE